MKKIKRDEEGYYPTPLGNFPSVTTILNVVKKVPGAWYSKMAVNYLRENLLDKVFSGEMTLEQFRELDMDALTKYAKATAKREYEKAGDIGTMVHGAIEAYFKNELQEIDPETYAPLEKPYNAFIDWVNRNEVRCLLSEHIVYSKIGYAGTLDFIGTINGKKYLVDFKSSKGFWPEMPMQVAAYHYAHEEMTGDKMEGVGILRLDKETGMPEWKEVPFDKLGHYMDKFLTLLAYWELDHDKDIPKW